MRKKYSYRKQLSIIDPTSDALKKKKRKAIKIIIIALIVCLIFSPVAGLSHVLLWRFVIPPTMHIGSEQYFSQDYMKYRGGTDAASRFPLPTELGEYEDIGFYHLDHRVKRMMRFSIPDAFYLEVRYSDENFQSACYDFFCRYTNIPDEEKTTAFESFWNRENLYGVDRYLYRAEYYEEEPFCVFYIKISPSSPGVIRFAYVYQCTNEPYSEQVLYYWDPYYFIGEVLKESESSDV